ncbi:uncharacterized protein LOC116256444 isoform X1 [Nymphaea colorata]|nr:uncharacterized protein LOC116256444 isoform X1 [Nymphaea colorata]XP_049934372.1 uncharacterized protein LOC116256444 isoform X1 [Nymphaea colorata]
MLIKCMLIMMDISVTQRSSLARVYALWNATSLSNILVSFICGLVYYGFLQKSSQTMSAQTFGRNREGDGWWVFPVVLFLFKCTQARFVDYVCIPKFSLVLECSRKMRFLF